MLNKIIAFIKKYPKDCAIVLTVLTLGIFAVMGTHWADTARSPFWWNFWIVASVISIVALVAAWVYAWITQPKDRP